MTDDIGVFVTQHLVDWNDLAWATLSHLAPFALPRELRNQDENAAKWLLTTYAAELGTLYATPMYTVRAKSASPSFFRAARDAQHKWRLCVRTTLRLSSRGWKRLIHHETPLVRQLMYTGVMIVGGRHVPPGAWQLQIDSSIQASNARNLTDDQFGRLTVLSRETGSRWLCRCECGNVTTVRASHLRAGRITSCGCLKRAVEARQQARREKRLLRYS